MTKVYAPLVRRRAATFPSRMRYFFDCSKWGSGFYPIGAGPGAVRLDLLGTMLNMQTGEVYHDARFERGQVHHV